MKQNPLNTMPNNVLQSGKPVITFWGDEQLADLDSAPHT